MLLQHMVRYHEAHNWIWLQDQEQLTYQTLLSHCQLLETWCEQFQKAKDKVQTDLCSLTAATTSLSIHQDSLTTHPKCHKYGYPYPKNQCTAYGWECYNCSSLHHYTALCRRPWWPHCSFYNARAQSSWDTRAGSPWSSGTHSHTLLNDALHPQVQAEPPP